MWLECILIGAVSGCCCKKVYRYPHNNYFSLLHLYYCIYVAPFLGSSIPTSLFIFKMFFRSLERKLQ